jgi:hypothetical protein
MMDKNGLPLTQDEREKVAEIVRRATRSEARAYARMFLKEPMKIEDLVRRLEGFVQQEQLADRIHPEVTEKVHRY